jgi:hypothetical protein
MNHIKKIALIALGLAVLGTGLPTQAKANVGVATPTNQCAAVDLICMWTFILTGSTATPSVHWWNY